MGLSLLFYSGNAEEIGKAVMDLEFENLDKVPHADLSLHIQPKDLDSLSREAAAVLGNSPVLLSGCIELVLVDEVDRGALLVKNEWVNQFAMIQPNLCEELVKRWM